MPGSEGAQGGGHGQSIRESLLMEIAPLRERLSRLSREVATRGWPQTADDLARAVALINELDDRIDAQLAGMPAPGDAREEGYLQQVRHALRNPLSAIVGYLELSMDEAEERGDRALAADIRQIRGDVSGVVLKFDRIIRSG